MCRIQVYIWLCIVSCALAARVDNGTVVAATSAAAVRVCSQPVEVGPCRAYVSRVRTRSGTHTHAQIPRFFYNRTSSECEPFVYGGCQGNENNFGTHQQCMGNCSSVPGMCALLYIVACARALQCVQPPTYHHCTAVIVAHPRPTVD